MRRALAACCVALVLSACATSPSGQQHSAAAPTATAAPMATTCPAARPAPRSGMGLSYDAGRHALVTFGGVVAANPSFRSSSETWTLSGGCWRLQQLTTSPPARDHPVMAYDSVRKVTVLYGGGQSSPGQPVSFLADTWIWDGQAWSQAAVGSSPNLFASAGAFDLAHGVLVVFGVAPGGMAQTWIWDGTRWTRGSPPSSPAARSDAMMGYDPTSQEVLLFGGFSQATGMCGDTWLW